MSTPQNDAFDIRAPKPIDKRYLKNEVTTWTSVAEVNAGIVSAYRYPGLTVLINNIEYWYKGGILDTNLVPKSDNAVTIVLTADGFWEAPSGLLVMALVVTPNIAINFKAGSAVGLEDFVPTMEIQPATTAIVVAIWRNTGQRIYFGGISGSNTTIIIKTL